MVNKNYTPTDNQESILNVLNEDRDKDKPWGRANPLYLREQTGLNKQQVNYALNQLMAAGWIVKITEGLYELVADPRTEQRDGI
jgi:Fe2+ or Zn2+ uptake regulation protein